jgi:uncharacterized protein with PIN domain
VKHSKVAYTVVSTNNQDREVRDLLSTLARQAHAVARALERLAKNPQDHEAVEVIQRKLEAASKLVSRFGHGASHDVCADRPDPAGGPR